MNSHAHRTAALSLLALGALVLQLPLHAQIKADPSAPGNQRPTLLQTANGVPQVNIQTPSPAGVSRNSYSQFDVDGRGVVLNNSRNNVQTRLGGLVSGNPWIARPARVILNEVNSSSPSYLRGYVEVAGQRAEVVIANPAGIQVSGGGFINASGVTLTTGTPVMNGGDLESFRVQRGQVTIDGTGLDTSTADYTRILARALQVNAGLWAKDLTALTGASEVKALAAGTAATATSMAGTGPAPTFTLDVAALGGMYAGKIFLVGTEAGLGVNNRGILAAQEGDLVLRADGWLVNTGSVYARGNTAIAVTGDVIRGSEVTAGNNASLKADGDVALVAAQNTASLSGSNKSSSASIGISFGTSGFGVTASASAGRGNQAGDDVTQSNTRVTAGNTATVKSGADTTLAGAVVQANTVKADVGGNLKIESLQDTSTYDSKQQNIGASVTFGANPGGSFNAAKSNIDSTYQSVTETSGIKSGGGGFQVSVGNNTNLKGGVIASNQSAVDNNKNSFTTGGQLTTSDIQNSANYSASSSSVSVGTGLPAQNLGISGVGVGAGSDSGQASSTTQAGISGFAGNTAVRSTDAETGIAKIFDQDKVRKEIDAQVKITETFGRNASKAVGDWAATQMKQATSLRDQARDETDPAKQADLLAQADQLEANWGDSGTLRVAAHTVIGGLTGGASGAAGALTGTLAAPAIADALNKAGITGPLASTLTGLGSTLIGAAAGGTPGGAAALNEVANNYLNHKQWSDLANKLKTCKTQAECEQVTKEFVTLSAQQDAEMRLACQDTSSVACRGHISSALSGSYTQMELVAAGILPANYAAGANLNAQANLLARNVIVADIKAACLADAACRQKQDNINGVVLLGTIGLVTAPMLPSLGSAAVAWIVANPVTAQMLGIISAETAMALATGAVSPNSIAEGLFALGAASTIKFVGGTAAGRNFVGGTTIKTLAEAADSVTAQSAAQAQKLNQELSTLAKVQPDTARDAFYLANTDQTILKANNFDMNHVLSGEINNAGRATGYHAELAAEGAARIRPGSAVTQNANGTYTAQVDVFDAAKGIWVEKVTNKGQSTFFKPSWSQARIEYEVAEAFKRGQTANPGQKSFTEFTPSGLQIQFHSDGNRTTFFPTGR